MGSFTPGPWSVDRYGNVEGPGDESIAVVTIWNGAANLANGRDLPESQANARLIKAAPKLLDACAAMIAWDAAENAAPEYASDGGAHWRMRQAMCGDAFDKAREAFNEATGD